jgi:hypothetical protein
MDLFLLSNSYQGFTNLFMQIKVRNDLRTDFQFGTLAVMNLAPPRKQN